MYLTKKITSKMRLNFSEINKDNKFYFVKNNKRNLVKILKLIS